MDGFYVGGTHGSLVEDIVISRELYKLPISNNPNYGYLKTLPGGK